MVSKIIILLALWPVIGAIVLFAVFGKHMIEITGGSIEKLELYRDTVYEILERKKSYSSLGTTKRKRNALVTGFIEACIKWPGTVALYHTNGVIQMVDEAYRRKLSELSKEES